MNFFWLLNNHFRNDINWLDSNFPREIRVHSVVFEERMSLATQ